MPTTSTIGDDLERDGLTLRNWQEATGQERAAMRPDAYVEMGWGRLIFGHTFDEPADLAEMLRDERPGRRHLALYVRDPHVVLAHAPQELFLDPSHTFRLWAHRYDGGPGSKTIVARHLKSMRDAQETMRIYHARGMVTCDPGFLVGEDTPSSLVLLVAESEHDGSILGTVTGVDHAAAFDDPEDGSSLWCLAVDPQAHAPGVGELLVRRLCEYFFARGRRFVDLSVLHDNESAIALYEKLGFERVPAFCVKRKNPINEPLFLDHRDDGRLNPYARIIVEEARRRGIGVEVIDDEVGHFRLTLGGRQVTCWESLSSLTSAIAMVRCDDKRLTHRVLDATGLEQPAQTVKTDRDDVRRFLKEHRAVVVKPARGEQGAGVSVDLRTVDEVLHAIEDAETVCPDVILESFHEGDDLRLIVIEGEVVAAAVRRPPIIVGTGEHTVRELVEKYNRRRMAATGGESQVPFDHETARCIEEAGYGLDEVVPAKVELRLRKGGNLHTGGTMHDVTDDLHPDLAAAAQRAVQALEIPVAGLDLIVDAPDRPRHVIIEANERPGLANHEPAPTAERFLDHLFPETAMGRA